MPNQEKKTSATHFIDNKEFYALIKRDIEKYREAIAAKQTPPRMSREVAEIIMLLCNNLAERPNFSGYSYKDEMIGDAIMTCVRYWHNFNPDKYNNAFAYFTTLAWQSFVRRLKAEKAISDRKFKYLEEMSTVYINDTFGESESENYLDIEHGNE